MTTHNNALIAAIEGGEKSAVKSAIGSAKPTVSITAAKEFLVKGDKGALRGFMKEVGAKVGSNGSSTEVNAMANSLGRKVGAGDASIIGGAIKNGATIITRDTKMSKFMEAAGVPFKTF